VKSFLEYSNEREFEYKLDHIKFLLEETGADGIFLVQKEIDVLMLNEGIFDRAKSFFGSKPDITLPNQNYAGTLGVDSKRKDYRNQIDVAVDSLRKVRDIYGAHHNVKIGGLRTNLENWLNNILQNLSRLRSGLPGPEANAAKLANFVPNVNDPNDNPFLKAPDNGSSQPIKRFRGTPEDTQFFRNIGATNKSNQWNKNFGI
jgi:hypothetical protein